MNLYSAYVNVVFRHRTADLNTCLLMKLMSPEELDGLNVTYCHLAGECLVLPTETLQTTAERAVHDETHGVIKRLSGTFSFHQYSGSNYVSYLTVVTVTDAERKRLDQTLTAEYAWVPEHELATAVYCSRRPVSTLDFATDGVIGSKNWPVYPLTRFIMCDFYQRTI